VEQTIVLARGLVDQGVAVTAACATPQLAERFAATGARAAVIPLRHFTDLAGALRLARLARGADVVHAHDRRTGLWTRLGPRPRRGGVRVYTVHGLPLEYHPPPVGIERPGVRAAIAYRGLDANLGWRADAVVVPSRSVAERLVTRLGYPSRRIVVIPNGIKARPSPSGRGDLVGTVSVLEQVKGLDVFLKAAAQLAAERPELRFVLYGRGSEEERLATLSRELGLGTRLIRAGHSESAQAFATLAVYVLSSYDENAPMALLEAMDAGVPVVATAVGGILEILDRDSAQIVEPGDETALARAIACLLDDPALASRQVEAARARVRRDFSAEVNARATLALYERLLSARADLRPGRGSRVRIPAGE